MPNRKNPIQCFGDNISGLVLMYKEIGETPLMALERLRKEMPQYSQAVLSYAGRLDPMAYGLLLVLVGEENKNRTKYLSLSKEYEFSVLWGVTTDTFDPLGLVTGVGSEAILAEDIVARIASGFLGKISQKYPAFSSKTLHGSPLFALERKGELSHDEIPEKEVFIKDIKIIKHYEISGEDILNYFKEEISLIVGDFRQQNILESWNMAFKDKKNIKFAVTRMSVSAQSGLYVRVLANSFGKKAGCGALAFDIYRTKIGDFKLPRE